LYLKASRLDEKTETKKEAVQLYEKAILLDPFLDIAYTNLGNCYFNLSREKARELYKAALRLAPNQPEAVFNLGYFDLAAGNAFTALPLFIKALEHDPKFSDAYFNAAMALEQLGQHHAARKHWRKYIELEPAGTWTEIARRHL